MPKKTTKPKKPAKTVKPTEAPKERYFEAVGRRKTASARVRLWKSQGLIVINQREVGNYFPLKKHEDTVNAPYLHLSLPGFKTRVLVKGGGPSAQAEAVRLGISRALVLLDEKLRPPLKALGYLRRDARMVERKKPGLRKARRAQQWRKR